MPDKVGDLERAGIPVSGMFDDLLNQVDVMLDATTAGIGAKNKELYRAKGLKAIFQGGEKDDSPMYSSTATPTMRRASERSSSS